MSRVKWDGRNTSAETFGALRTFGLGPVGGPGNEQFGIEAEGEPDTLVFRDAHGEVKTARPGDEIEGTPNGWLLHPAPVQS